MKLFALGLAFATAAMVLALPGLAALRHALRGMFSAPSMHPTSPPEELPRDGSQSSQATDAKEQN